MANVPPRKPIDTSELGPVKIDANADAARAKIVRDAMRATGNYHLGVAAGLCDDAVLAKLGRMLK